MFHAVSTQVFTTDPPPSLHGPFGGADWAPLWPLRGLWGLFSGVSIRVVFGARNVIQAPFRTDLCRFCAFWASEEIQEGSGHSGHFGNIQKHSGTFWIFPSFSCGIFGCPGGCRGTTALGRLAERSRGHSALENKATTDRPAPAPPSPPPPPQPPL